MSGARLIESLQHIHQAATDACGFIEGMTEADFLADKLHAANGGHEPHHRGRGGDQHQ